ncbi:unnamed protein product [Darwinula stevensoni]|uniref:Protein flightless-1 homolog n=1 Tax=Darwinula stevensoni TaxID=69355 RepID=A0A7R8XCV1_9CRUS|nr:unnamed protein product [Darwinula stevensoni]CAG0886127.1 unnamed protein product [Darwinula stevensoni]
MAQTGVLPFVRGVDLSSYDFDDKEKFPCSVQEMSGLRWLKANRSHLTEIPESIAFLDKLEQLSIKNNELTQLHGELTQLPNLRVLNVRKNRLRTSGIPSQLFDLEDLTTLDLSHNLLKEVPEGLDKAHSLLVLNLSHNQIESIPNNLLVGLIDLLTLDLSNNKLESLPPQLRRLINLQTLILNDNPLSNFQFRQLPSLVSLTTLHMRNTKRTLSNLPGSLEGLLSLEDVDFSCNELTKVPDCLYSLANLKRLNLSDNCISDLSLAIDLWSTIQVLNLSRNNITVLPNSICRLSKLRRLYVSFNRLTFEGLPAGMGKLGSLQVFSASNNQLEMIPEGLCRCGQLKVLDLRNNQLITLPDTIHLIQELELHIDGNPNLYIPPKPSNALAPSIQFYNVDFNKQARLCSENIGMPPPPPVPSATPSKDPIARKLRLRRRKDHEEADQDQAKILKGMKEIAKVKNKQGATQAELGPESLKPKRWEETLEKPPLDYSEFFEVDVGQIPGLTVWEIENFLPNMLEEALHGNFFEADCYIVLHTFIDDSNSLDWKIFFWIGSKAPLDKRACSAIHAVNLRNYLGAECRTAREEQGEESEEFLELFNGQIAYIEGGRTSSGFYTVEKPVYLTRLYRVHTFGQHIHLESVAVEPSSLEPHFIFILDNGPRIFLWIGNQSKSTIRSKSRLLIEKINKNERKNLAELFTFMQGEEPIEFWSVLGCEVPPTTLEVQVQVDSSWQKKTPRLYQVGLGMGYLELPQVELPKDQLTMNILLSKQVYILDCYNDIFVWIGKSSTRLVRAAAFKLSEELLEMMPMRSKHSAIIRVTEGTEPQVFKSKFEGWDDVIAVDFTRTVESVRKTGADLIQWAKKQETKVDLTALFMTRQPSMPHEEAMQLMEEWNEDLDHMDTFVLEGRKFVRLPEEEYGHFYSGDSYVFLCRYWIPLEVDEGEGPKEEEEGKKDEVAGEESGDEFKYTVYFWQGRDASNMGWLTFTFDLQKKFESVFGEKLEVIRMQQQQENFRFLSHFRGKLMIHRGHRRSHEKAQVELYQVRANGSFLCTRTIQIATDAAHLNSAFCLVLRVPFNEDGNKGIVYAWIGGKASVHDANIAQEVAQGFCTDRDDYSMQVINEGEEPENFFWVGIGGRKPYGSDADFMAHTRLFRCSNDKGYFAVSEKCTDFCQDDLADDDIMLLDNGQQVFLWIGPLSSEVELKLSYKAAQRRVISSLPDSMTLAVLQNFLTGDRMENAAFYVSMTQLTKILDEVMQGTDPEGRWNAVLKFCEFVTRENNGVATSIKLLAEKIQSIDEREAEAALEVLESCARRCGPKFQSEIGKFRFLNEMVKLVSPKYLGSRTSPKVKGKVIELLYLWSRIMPEEPKIKEAYDMLKAQNIIKSDPDVPLCDAGSKELEKEDIFTDQESMVELKKLLQSKKVEDVQKANRLIKKMVKENEERAAKKSRRTMELERVAENVSLLSDMLRCFEPRSATPEVQDTMHQLYKSCRELRNSLASLGTETEDSDPDALAAIIKASEDIEATLNSYEDTVLKGHWSGGNSFLLDLTSTDETEPQPDSPLDSQLLELGFLDSEPKTTQEVSRDPLEEIFGSIIPPSEPSVSVQSSTTEMMKIQKKLPDPSVPQFKHPLVSARPEGSQELNNSEPVVEEVKAPFADIEKLIRSSIPAAASLPQMRYAGPSPKVALRDMIVQQKQQEEEAAKARVNSVDVTKPNLKEAPSVPPPVKSPPPSAPSPLPVVSATENAVNASPRQSSIDLIGISIPLEGIEPSSSAPLLLWEEHGVSLHLQPAECMEHPDVGIAVVTLTNRNKLPLSSFVFQALPKGRKSKLMPPSATEIPGFKPFLPPPVISQVLVLPNKEKFHLKYVLCFTLGDELYSEKGSREDVDLS